MSGRDDIVAIARAVDHSKVVDCPICNTAVKAKNLVRHYDKSHAGVDAEKEKVEASISSAQSAAANFGHEKQARLANRFKALKNSESVDSLLEKGAQQLYRENIFRVLGLNIRASSQDVRNHQRKLELHKKFGGHKHTSTEKPLPISPEPNEGVVDRSMRRLNEPEERILDELFWIWPIQKNINADPAWRAIIAGRPEEAIDIWNACEDPEYSEIAQHNLAVYHHLRAIDLEIDGQYAQADQHWASALELWARVIEREGCWTFLRERIIEVDDQRLTTGLARRLRDTMPNMLLSINAGFAVAAAERGDGAQAKRHLKHIRNADYGLELERKALHDATRAYRRRVNSLVDGAKAHWERDPRRANKIVRALKEDANDVLAIVKMLLKKGDLVRASIHDSIAEAMLSGQIAYARTTNDFVESINLLELAKEIAEGRAAIDRLDDNLQQINELISQANHWCAEGYWALPDDAIAKLEKARGLADNDQYEEALRTLVELQYSGYGQPIRRCISYCLSLEGIISANAAQREYNSYTSVYSAVLETASTTGIRRPFPEMEHWQTPECPGTCGGNTNYTSWTIFDHNGFDLFMCPVCKEKHDAEQAEQKHKFTVQIKRAYQYLLLAQKIDPEDAGVSRNCKTIGDIAHDFDIIGKPGTWSIKSKFGIDFRGLQSDTPIEPKNFQFPQIPTRSAVRIGAAIGLFVFVISGGFSLLFQGEVAKTIIGASMMIGGGALVGAVFSSMTERTNE